MEIPKTFATTITNVLGRKLPVLQKFEDCYICPFCLYPTGGPCSNPGCTANPQVTPEQAKAWEVEAATREAEEQERHRFNRIRMASFTGAFDA